MLFNSFNRFDSNPDAMKWHKSEEECALTKTALPSKQPLKNDLKRKREDVEVQEAKIDFLCEKAMTQISAAKYNGLETPNSSLKALSEAKKINSDHSKVKEMELFLRESQPKVFEEVSMIILLTQANVESYQKSKGSSQYWLDEAVKMYHLAKKMMPQHPQVLEFELKFEYSIHLFG